MDALEGPAPVEAECDGGVAAVEGQVAHSELLVAHGGADVAAVHGDVGHEACRAVLDEEALVQVARRGRQVDLDVLDARGLARVPVEGRDLERRVDGRHVDAEVADLAPEDVGRAEALVVVAVEDEAVARGPRSVDEQRGHAVWVADELRVVEVEDRARDPVRAGRQVDDGRRGGRGLAPTGRVAASLSGYGCVDGRCIIGDAVPDRVEVRLDVAEHLVPLLGEGREALVLDALEPEVRA